MGGYLTIPESQSDHDFINLFLDTNVGEPNYIASGMGLHQGWYLYVMKIEILGLLQSSLGSRVPRL